MFRKQFVALALGAAALGFVAVPATAQLQSGNSVIPDKVQSDPLPDNSLPPGAPGSLERGESPGMDSQELCDGTVAPDDRQRCESGVNPPAATDGPSQLTPSPNDDEGGVIDDSGSGTRL